MPTASAYQTTYHRKHPALSARPGMALLVIILVITWITASISLALIVRQKQTNRRIRSYLDNQFSFYSSYGKTMDNIRLELNSTDPSHITTPYQYLQRATVTSSRNEEEHLVSLESHSTTANTSQRATRAVIRQDPVFITVLFDVSSSMFEQDYTTHCSSSADLPGCLNFCLSTSPVSCQPFADALLGLEQFLNTFAGKDYVWVKVIPYNIQQRFYPTPDFIPASDNAIYPSEIIDAVKDIQPIEYTNLNNAIQLAVTELAASMPAPPTRKFLVILSDGQPTAGFDSTGQECYNSPRLGVPPACSQNQIDQQTIDQANQAKQRWLSADDHPLVIYALKYGNLPDQVLQQHIVTQPGDPGWQAGRRYYHVADSTPDIPQKFQVLAAQLLHIIEINPE